MTPQQEYAAILTAWAQDPSPTAPGPLFAGSRLMWNAHNLAAEVACDLGEAAMKRKNQQRGKECAAAAWHSWPAFCARFYARETWRGLPGPWPVKLALMGVCLAVPGPADEIALLAVTQAFRARHARKAVTQ